MMDFMSHLLESMLCKAISRSPGVSGDTVELPSPEKQPPAGSLEPLCWINQSVHVAMHEADGHSSLTVLSPQQTVEHLLHHDGVEFD